jgi:hypothetical protein
MKKVLFGVLGLAIAAAGVSLDGRIGMGIGLSPDTYFESAALGLPLPVIDMAATRIGLNPKLSVEPILLFDMVDYGDTEMKLGLSILCNFLMKGHQKTNLYTKAGIGFVLDSPAGAGETQFGFNLPFGFGLEHFVSEHFSLNLSALSGITFISNYGHGTESLMELKLGNAKPFAFYLLWYY